MKTITTIALLLLSQISSAAQLFKTTEYINRAELPITEQSAMVVQVNKSLLLNRTQQFDIFLPDGINATVVFDQMKSHDNNRFSWFGQLKGQPQDQLIISVVDDHYAGSLYTETVVYEFSSGGQGLMRIAELVTENFEECDGDIEPATKTETIESLDSESASTQRGVTVEFDVMILYTPEARDGAGGVAGIEATAQAAVDAMNLSFSNSNVDAEGTISYLGLANYNDTGNSSTDLTWVRNDPTVAALRNNFGADMVSLLVNNMSGCGRGYVMRSPGPGFAGSAFQVTRRSCAVGNLSFAHEFGHNMGLEHNPEDSSASSASASNPWSFGHYHNGSYRTVMSYSAQCANGCSRRQYFSNPDVQFNDLATGIDGSRDNARTLEQTAAIVADFRPTFIDLIYEDGFEE